MSKARVSKMGLPHQVVDTPVFMPVGTQGTLKGVTSQQLVDMDCQIILGNTYHLGNKPVSSLTVPLESCETFSKWCPPTPDPRPDPRAVTS